MTNWFLANVDDLYPTPEQVAQGQYVVSSTHCPALHDCKGEEAGQ